MLKKSKYNNKKTIINGITFDSKKEADRYVLLKQREAIGEILDLTLQTPFPYTLEGKKMFTYKCDFMYYDRRTGNVIVEDVKGFLTPVYKLKKKIIEAHYKIKITEI